RRSSDLRLLEALGSILEDRTVPLVSDFFFLALLVIYGFLFVLFLGEDTIREPVLLSLLGGEPRLLLHPLLDDIPLEARLLHVVVQDSFVHLAEEAGRVFMLRGVPDGNAPGIVNHEERTFLHLHLVGGDRD